MLTAVFYTLKWTNTFLAFAWTPWRGVPTISQVSPFYLGTAFLSKKIFCLIQNISLYNFYPFVLFMFIGDIKIQSKDFFFFTCCYISNSTVLGQCYKTNTSISLKISVKEKKLENNVSPTQSFKDDPGLLGAVICILFEMQRCPLE